MSLNIKNERTHKLVNQLAELTGESKTEAVTKAVQERLDRVRGREVSDRVQRLSKIATDAASRIKEPFRSIDHAEFLYDEKGLPK